MNWFRKKRALTIEFLGLWETMHNPDFKGVEFDRFRKEAEQFERLFEFEEKMMRKGQNLIRANSP